MTPTRALLAITIVGSVSVWLASDRAHRLASRRGFSSTVLEPREPYRQAVVVLGYRNRGARANLVNRIRVRSALRALDAAAAARVLVCCGGAVGGPVPEAELLAAYARERGVRDPIRLDRTSRTTVENVRNAIPLVEDADRIAFVSDPLHAERARLILRRLRPDLACRLESGREYRFGWHPIITIVTALRAPEAMRRTSAMLGTTPHRDR